MANDFPELNGVAQDAIDNAIDLATQDFSDFIRPSAEQVRAAALDLINYAEELRAKSQTNINALAEVKAETPAAAVKFSKKMVQTKEEFKKLMGKVLDFQNISNEFLGQKVQMTFVSIAPKTGKVTLYAVDNSVEDIGLDRASKSHGGDITGRYKQGIIKKMAQQMTNSNYDSSSLDSTFAETYERYKISKARLRLKGAAYILWKENGWDGAWISGAGPLGEAFVNFFVNEYKFNGMMETNVKDFMMNNQYGAVLADNASGFLQGDVTKGALEFGVKINAATALGYMDIIGYAQDLLNAADVEQYLLALKEQLREKGVNNMVRPLEGVLNEEVESLLAPLEERISNGYK